MSTPVELILQIRDLASKALADVAGASSKAETALDGVVDAAERAAEAEKTAAAAAETLAAAESKAAAAAAGLASTEAQLAKEIKASKVAFTEKAKALGITEAELRKVEAASKKLTAAQEKEVAAARKAAAAAAKQADAAQRLVTETLKAEAAAEKFSAEERALAAEVLQAKAAFAEKAKALKLTHSELRKLEAGTKKAAAAQEKEAAAAREAATAARALAAAAGNVTAQEVALAAAERKAAKEAKEAAAAFRRKAQALGLTKDQMERVVAAEKQATLASQKNRQALTGVSTALQAVTLAALAAAAGIVKLNQDQADYVNTVNDLARNLDFQASTLQALGVAAGDAGKDLGSLQELLTGFNSRLEQAKKGTGEAVEALSDLGFGEDQLRSFASTDEAFRAITDRLVEMGDRTAAAGLASRIFGEQGSQLFSILQDGTKTLDAANARVQKFGVSTTGEAAERAAEWQRQVTDVDLAYQGLTGTLAVEYGPTIVEAIGDSLELIQTLRGLTEGTGELLGTWKAFNAFSLAFKGLSSIFEFWRDLFREIGDKVSEILGLAKTLEGLELLARGPERETSGPPAVTVFDNDEAGGTAPVITEIKGEGGAARSASDALAAEQEALARALQAFEVATAIGAQGVLDLGAVLDALTAEVGDGALTGELDDLTGRLNAAATAAAAALETTLGERAFGEQLAPLEAAIAEVNTSTYGLAEATDVLAEAMAVGAENIEAAVAAQKRAVQNAMGSLTGDISGLLEDGLRKVFTVLGEALGADSKVGAKFAAAAAGPVGLALSALETVGAAGGETPEGEERVSTQAGDRSAEAIGGIVEDAAANILNGVLALPGLLIEFLPEFAVDLAREIARMPFKLAAGVFESLDGLLKKVFGEAWANVKEFFRELLTPGDETKREERKAERKERRESRNVDFGFSFGRSASSAPAGRSTQEQIAALIGPQAVQSFEPPRFSATSTGVVRQVDRLAEAGTTFAAAAGGRGGGEVVVNNYGVMTGDPARELNRRERRSRNGYGRNLSPTPFEG